MWCTEALLGPKRRAEETELASLEQEYASFYSSRSQLRRRKLELLDLGNNLREEQVTGAPHSNLYIYLLPILPSFSRSMISRPTLRT